MSEHDKRHKDGKEHLDPTPISVPIGWKRPLTLNEQIRQMVRSEELRRFALSSDQETFEEADDFDVGDDFDPTAPYEQDFDLAAVQAIDHGLVKEPPPPPPSQPKSKMMQDENPDESKRSSKKGKPSAPRQEEEDEDAQ